MTTPPPEPAALRDEITRTREELRDTVDALATEISPRTHARRAADRTKRTVSGNPVLSIGLAVGVVAFAVGITLWKRSR